MTGPDDPRKPMTHAELTRQGYAEALRPEPDDDGKPMTRTELAMLWDLLGTWLAGHSTAGYIMSDLTQAAEAVRADIDTELAERFGG